MLRKRCICHFVVGGGKSRIAWMCTLSGQIPFSKISWLRKSMVVLPKQHFDGLSITPNIDKHSKTRARWWQCSTSSWLATRRSSIYAKKQTKLHKTWSIKCWKVCAAFCRPNGMCRNLNSSKGVVIAVFVTSSGATGIWWKACTKSIVENIFLPVGAQYSHGCVE